MFTYVYALKHLYVVKSIILCSAIAKSLFVYHFFLFEICVWQTYWTFKIFQITVRMWFYDKNAHFCSFDVTIVSVSVKWLHWHVLMTDHKLNVKKKLVEKQNPITCMVSLYLMDPFNKSSAFVMSWARCVLLHFWICYAAWDSVISAFILAIFGSRFIP